MEIAAATAEETVEETVVETVVEIAAEIAAETVGATEEVIEAIAQSVEETEATAVQADVAKEAAHGEAAMVDEDGVGTKVLVDHAVGEDQGNNLTGPLWFNADASK